MLRAMDREASGTSKKSAAKKKASKKASKKSGARQDLVAAFGKADDPSDTIELQQKLRGGASSADAAGSSKKLVRHAGLLSATVQKPSRKPRRRLKRGHKSSLLEAADGSEADAYLQAAADWQDSPRDCRYSVGDHTPTAEQATDDRGDERTGPHDSDGGASELVRADAPLTAQHALAQQIVANLSAMDRIKFAWHNELRRLLKVVDEDRKALLLAEESDDGCRSDGGSEKLCSSDSVTDSSEREDLDRGGATTTADEGVHLAHEEELCIPQFPDFSPVAQAADEGCIGATEVPDGAGEETEAGADDVSKPEGAEGSAEGESRERDGDKQSYTTTLLRTPGQRLGLELSIEASAEGDSGGTLLVVVSAVEEGSAADEANMDEGDVLTTVNHAPVTPETMNELLLESEEVEFVLGVLR